MTSGGSTPGRGGHRPLQIVVRPRSITDPQLVARPPNLAVLLTHCGQLLLTKISKFHATGCQILRPKCTKFDFRWGSAPDPAGGAYRAHPDPIPYLSGSTSKGRERRDGKGKRNGKERGKDRERGGKRSEKGGNGRAPPIFWPRTAPEDDV